MGASSIAEAIHRAAKPEHVRCVTLDDATAALDVLGTVLLLDREVRVQPDLLEAPQHDAYV